jgi:peptidoglycan/xylan/chitin deacetylase (PgdA/CDA1 family)
MTLLGHEISEDLALEGAGGDPTLGKFMARHDAEAHSDARKYFSREVCDAERGFMESLHARLPMAVGFSLPRLVSPPDQ